MRRFVIVRPDPDRQWGPRRMAEGCRFSDGTCALRWSGRVQSVVIHGSLDGVLAAHCAPGKCQLVWLDD